MKSHILLGTIALCLVSSISGFGLIGQWHLSSQHLDWAKDLQATNVTFTFSQQVTQQDTISNQIVVTTCRTMFYVFTYRENSIIPVFVKFGNNTRQCVNDEVNEIRRKMQSVFYFSIVDNRLILIYPSRLVAFTLFKNTTLPQGIKGEWDIVEVNGKTIEKETIVVQEDKIRLCGGNRYLAYKVDAGNKITIGEGYSEGECNKTDIIDALKNSKFYSKDSDELKLFNDNIQPTIYAKSTPHSQKLSPFQKQKLHDKWYIHSINGTQLDKQTQKIYYYYFLIITPERFRFYGGCNVEFSFYDFINGFEVNHREVYYVKAPSCRYVNEDTYVLNGLFDNGKYVQYNEQTGILSFFDAQYRNIIEFTTIMPQTRDILPTANI